LALRYSLICTFYLFFFSTTGTGVSTYSLHPGVVSTELTRHWKKSLLWKPLLFLGEHFFKTPEEGAQTTIYCTVEESLASETGKYYRYVLIESQKIL
jgi:hypothetical protein